MTSLYLTRSLETFIIADYVKTAYHLGKEPNAYFFRNASGVEVGLIIEQSGVIYAIEIKAATTFRQEFLKSLDYIKNLDNAIRTYLIYKGDKDFKIKAHKVVSVKNIYKLWEQILKSG